MGYDGEDVTITAKFVHETDRAVLVEVDDDELWLPKSQLVDYDDGAHEKGDEIELTVRAWLAKQKGLS